MANPKSPENSSFELGHDSQHPTIESVLESGKIDFLIPVELLEQQLQQERAKDRALGISRSKIPAVIYTLEDSPQTRVFFQLLDRIRSVAIIKLLPENSDQAAMLRCIQFYWEAQSLWLTNEICNRYLPDLPERAIRPFLPRRAFENLSLEIPSEIARYQLFRAGERDIRHWCEQEGIVYPFSDVLKLFVQTLQEDFDRAVENCFRPSPRFPTKVDRRKEHRDWVRFWTDYFTGDPVELEFIHALQQSGWSGYSLLAIWQNKNKPHLRKLWAAFTKTQRNLTPLIDHEISWKNGVPRQGGTTSQKIPIKSRITEEGYFEWLFQR